MRAARSSLGSLFVALVALGCAPPPCPAGYVRVDGRCHSASDGGTPGDGGDGGERECGDEICDGRDGDCDMIEDGFDTEAHASCAGSMPNATSRCAGSACELLECEGAYLDCTDAPGCETDPSTSRDHCGECGHGCVWDCVDGACDDPVEIGGGWLFACALRARGSVVCWGWNETGRLGDGTTESRSAPVAVLGIDDAVDLAVGEHHACVIRRDRSVWCWGRNDLYQLGRGSVAPYSATPVRVLEPEAGVVELAPGGFHTCARLESSRVVCWGEDASGQLGDGSPARDSEDPVDTGLTDIVEISSGSFHSCARRASGAVVCWGGNVWGQLGDGTTEERASPPAVDIAGLVATSIRAGGSHTCATRTSGELVCWGGNLEGELGIRSTEPQRVPDRPVRGLRDAMSFALGSRHTCAVVAGDAYCWGDNFYGALGNGMLLDLSVPQETPVLSGVLELVAAGHNTCARTSRDVICWGIHESGELGDGVLGTVGQVRRTPGAPVLAPAR